MNSIKCIIFAELISADNDKYPEEIKQQMLTRFNKDKEHPNWEYILEPLGDEAEPYLAILNEELESGE